MLCPKCSLPTEVDVQSVIDAAVMSDRFDDNGVPLPHRRQCLYHHDTWVGRIPPGTTAPRPCARHGRPYPCRSCGSEVESKPARAVDVERRLRTIKWEAPCTCGCGQTFITNGRRRFFSDACRLRVAAREAARERARLSTRAGSARR